MDRESRPLVVVVILTICGVKCSDNTHRPHLGHRQVPWRPMDNLVDPLIGPLFTQWAVQPPGENPLNASYCQRYIFNLGLRN
jgi:hypothetical protein